MRATESTHSRYRKQLEALADWGVVLQALEEAGQATGSPDGAAWARIHERFEPDREPYASCVVATSAAPQQIARIDAFRDRTPAPVPGAAVVRAGAAGHLQIARVPPDPALPALARMLAGREKTLVRYHPGRGCTIRVEDGARTRFAKLYADARGERVHEDGVQLWHAAHRGELAFVVAEPERYDAELGAVWQRAVAGKRVMDRLRRDEGEDLACRLGRAAGSLSRARLQVPARRDRKAELSRTARRCAELTLRVPDLGKPVERLLRALEAAQAACGPPDPRPVHGALHVAQWLENGSGLALLDYDSLGVGDPELDAATFLADLDFQNPERVPVDRLNAAFLTAFEAAVGGLDMALLATYRTQRRLEKALRAARAIRPDGDRAARRRLEMTLACLGVFA